MTLAQNQVATDADPPSEEEVTLSPSELRLTDKPKYPTLKRNTGVTNVV